MIKSELELMIGLGETILLKYFPESLRVEPKPTDKLFTNRRSGEYVGKCVVE